MFYFDCSKYIKKFLLVIQRAFFCENNALHVHCIDLQLCNKLLHFINLCFFYIYYRIKIHFYCIIIIHSRLFCNEFSNIYLYVSVITQAQICLSMLYSCSCASVQSDVLDMSLKKCVIIMFVLLISITNICKCTISHNVP